jgi:DNA-binding NtrC family response regulator
MVILFIEDDRPTRESLLEHLSEWGCNVIDGDSVEEVLSKLKQEDVLSGPHLILSDYRLRKGKTGLDAITMLRDKTNKSLPAVIYTAESGPETLREIALNGITTFAKPVELSQLLTVVAKFSPKAMSAGVVSTT